MRKYVPNFLTSLNLFSGCVASVMAFHGNYLWVVIWIVIAAAFDFSDGFAARLLKSYSPMGKELDSLADVVSFGVAPSIALFSLLSQEMLPLTENTFLCEYFPFIGFLIAVFSGLRLAKFNIDTRQSESFIGLNVPANALFWSSVVYTFHRYGQLVSPLWIAVQVLFIIIFSLLLVSELPMFSFKIKKLSIKGNQYRLLLIVLCIIFLSCFGLTGIGLTILVYIILSMINNKRPA